MKPQRFFRSPEQPIVVLLTYSFDPVFFERSVLPELVESDARHILVIADRNEIESGLPQWAEHVCFLGQRYELCAADSPGHFHPKLMLRGGDGGALAWVGSGNLTFGGLGGNQELAACWSIGPDQADTGDWLPGLMESISTCVTSQSAKNILESVSRLRWLPTKTPPSTASPVIYSAGSIALSSAIEQRLVGRRFQSARILTGSTDDSAEVPRWLHRTFGVTDVEVTMQPTFCDFVAAECQNLPLSLRVRQSTGPNRLHGKAYHLIGQDGDALVFGSANCSAAAWLVPPAVGGNVEIVTVLPTVDRTIAEALWKDRCGAEFALSDDHFIDTPEEVDPWVQKTSIQHVVVTQDRVRVILRGSTADLAAVRIALFEQYNSPPAFETAGTADDDRNWWAEIPAQLNNSSFLFVRVSISAGPDRPIELTHWCTQHTKLERFSGRRRSAVQVPRILRGNDDALSAEMATTIQHIFNEYFDIDAPPPPPPPGPSKKSVEPASPCDPVSLLRSIQDAQAQESGAATSSSASTPGFNALLESIFSYDVDDPYRIDAIPMDPSHRDNLGDSPKTTNRRQLKEARQIPETDSKLKARLETLISSRIGFLGEANTARSLPPTQLLAGICFTARLLSKASENAWLTSEAVRALMVRLIDQLLRVQRNKAMGVKGILQEAEIHAQAAGLDDQFRSAIHDGRLWLTLLSAVVLTDCWQETIGKFEKALAIHDVLTATAILPADDENAAARMRTLYWRLDEDEQEQLASAVLSIHDRLRDLTASLEHHWSKVANAAKMAPPCGTNTSDLLWRPVTGWAWAVENAVDDYVHLTVHLHATGTTTDVRNGFYLNVTEVAKRDPVVQANLASLIATVP